MKCDVMFIFNLENNPLEINMCINELVYVKKHNILDVSKQGAYLFTINLNYNYLKFQGDYDGTKMYKIVKKKGVCK